MLADYLEIKGITEHEKKIIKQVEHKNLYNGCFIETAKLWKNYDIQINLIESIKSGRKFIKKGKIAYFEVFQEPRTELMGFSKKISLLYAPLEEDNDNWDKNKCIGFRYYEKSKLEKCNYFTLVKKYGNKFFILEKDKNILDFKGDNFYDENLNCYSVMKNIIFEKYKNDIVTPKGEVFPEIIGFSYSLISIGKFKGFIAVEPLILEPLNEESRIEKLPENLQEKIGYIEPIIFDNHISVVLIKKSTIYNRNRVNIILDMSRYHIEENISDNIVFPEQLYLNYYPYPKYSIQKGNSCGLWYYGIIQCIYENEKYKNIDDVCFAVNCNNSDFYIDVINCLSNNIYGISDIIDNCCMETSQSIKENRVYELGQISNYSFRKEAIMSYFFSLASLYAYYENKKDNCETKFIGIELLFEYQYLMDNIKDFLSLINFNNNYFKIFSPKEIYENEQKHEYKKLIDKLERLLNKVIQNYGKEFNNVLYRQFEDYLNFGYLKNKALVRNTYNKLKSMSSKIDKSEILDINGLKKEFEDFKYCDRKVVIKEESTIAKYLNPKNDFYFQMMIH